MEIGELKKLFDDMTIEEKAGQLFQTVGAMYDDEAVISGPMQEMGITEKDIQLAGTVLGTMGAEKIKRIQKKYMEAHPHCIFRKNCASVPEERSAIPLQTEQSSAG